MLYEYTERPLKSATMLRDPSPTAVIVAPAAATPPQGLHWWSWRGIRAVTRREQPTDLAQPQSHVAETLARAAHARDRPRPRRRPDQLPLLGLSSRLRRFP